MRRISNIMARRRMIILVSLGVVAVALLVASQFMSIKAPIQRRTDAPFGAYAGYIWFGGVSSAQGEWRVPVIPEGSKLGFGTTWIGAQASGSHGAFIQIGTAEQRGYSSDHVIENRYWAFWSDTTRNYHPRQLFLVKSKDRVKVAIKLYHADWWLTVTDTTSHKTMSLATREGSAPLNLAQWTQEDALASGGSRYPYPLLTNVRIQHLIVNGTKPRYAALYSTWMSVNGISLAPSPLRRDGFVLRPTDTSVAGRRYLDPGSGEGRAIRQFGYELERWSPTTPRHTMVSSASRLVQELRAETNALQNMSLPLHAKALATFCRHKLDAIIAQARLASRISQSAVNEWRVRVTQAADEARYADHLLRRSLGLPELP